MEDSDRGSLFYC